MGMGEKYEKLVRDGIPAKLDAKSVTYEQRTANGAEYRRELTKKLLEEAREFAADGSVEELADVLEVVTALRTLPEYADVEIVQNEKRARLGGFGKRFILKGEKD